MKKSLVNLQLERVEKAILLVRGEKVILDADLAALYGVTTTRLNEQVKRNKERFPGDFAFRLTKKEFTDLISQSATSSAAVCFRSNESAVQSAHSKGLLIGDWWIQVGSATHRPEGPVVNSHAR